MSAAKARMHTVVDTTRFPALAAELAQAKMALIVALSTPAALAAKQATQSIPIVTVAIPMRNGAEG